MAEGRETEVTFLGAAGEVTAFAAIIRERLHWPSVEVPQRGDRVGLA